MGSSGGASQSEMYAIQKKAREDAEREMQEKQKKLMESAQKTVDAGDTETVGGEGSGAGEGALSSGKKKKGTLTGEGESTFSRATTKLGE